MQNPFTRRFLKAMDLILQRGDVGSQEEFAAAMEFHPNYIGAFKAGRKQVRVEHLHKLHTIFGVSLYYVFIEKGPIMQDEEIPETYEVIKKRLKKAREIITVQEDIIHYKDKEIEYYKRLLQWERENKDSSIE